MKLSNVAALTAAWLVSYGSLASVPDAEPGVDIPSLVVIKVKVDEQGRQIGVSATPVNYNGVVADEATADEVNLLADQADSAIELDNEAVDEAIDQPRGGGGRGFGGGGRSFGGAHFGGARVGGARWVGGGRHIGHGHLGRFGHRRFWAGGRWRWGNYLWGYPGYGYYYPGYSTYEPGYEVEPSYETPSYEVPSYSATPSMGYYSGGTYVPYTTSSYVSYRQPYYTYYATPAGKQMPTQQAPTQQMPTKQQPK